ncbi:MAG TPA: hypothetical protein VFP57_03260 [Sphingomicrobium sp.]|jgi:predicted small secreted protein|nr:hypothetical protein [Sphingomicrobium sp.]
MCFERSLIAAAACLMLAGCNTANKHIGEEDPFLGEAVKYNAAVQTINPSPVYPEGGAQPGDSGEKGVAAVKRYRSDQVKQPKSISTSSGSGGPN